MRAIWTISVLLVAAGLSVAAGLLMFDFATVEPEFAGLGSFVFGVALGTLSQLGLLMSPFSCNRGTRRRVISAILMLPAYLLLGLVAMDIVGRFVRGAPPMNSWLIAGVFVSMTVYTLSLVILMRPSIIGAARDRPRRLATRIDTRRLHLLLGIAVIFC